MTMNSASSSAAAGQQSHNNNANNNGKKKGRNNKNKNNGTTAAGSDDAESVKSFVYTHPKPRVITDALFMWEHVSSFSQPQQVGEVERVCKDVQAHMQTSSTSNKLMQRYWNAQWTRMVWDEGMIPVEKRLLLPSSLSRSEGKINWRKTFVEEYPLWLKRTFMGKGSDNNANNAAKVFFQREVLNELKTAEEMERMQLTVEESIAKAMEKRGIEVKAEVVEPHGSPRTRDRDDGKAEMGGRRGVKVPVKDHKKEGYSRDDYIMNPRQGARKGKHAKGGDKKWSSFADFEDA